jgi:hypothetical protein
MATVGELLVVFRASTGAFTKDLDKVSKLSFDTSKEIERSFKRIGGVIAAELITAASAVTAAIAHTIDSAENMGLLARQVGFTAEQFSSLAYAAKLSDVPVETLSSSLVIMTQNLERSNEATLEGKAAHSALATLFRGNIPVFRDANDAFVRISQKLSELPNDLQRTALQAQIFGKGSKQMTDLVLEGASGIAKLRAEAQSFGVVISDKTAKAADEFNDTLVKIKAVLDGLLIKLAEELLPVLQRLANSLLVNANNTSAYAARINILSTAVKVLVTAVLAVAGALDVMGNALATVISGLIFDFSKPKESWAMLKESASQTSEAFMAAVEKIQNVWADLGNMPPVETPPIKIPGAGDDSWRAAQKAAEELRKAFESANNTLQDQIITLAHGGDALTLYKLKTLGATEAQLDMIRAQQRVIDNLEHGRPAFNTVWDNFLLKTSKVVESLDTLAASTDKFSSDEFDNLQAAEKMYTGLIFGPLAEYYKAKDQLILLNKNEKISNEELASAVNLLNHQYGLVSETVAKTTEFTKFARKEFDKMFTDAIFNAKSFTDAIGDMIKSFAELIFRALVLKPIMDELFGVEKAGGGSTGGLLGGFLAGIAGFFAGGGTAYAGNAYVVGEKGPEVFYPGVTGTVMPNGAGGQTIYNIDARGADPTVEFRIRRALAETENRAVSRAVVTSREMGLRNI